MIYLIQNKSRVNTTLLTKITFWVEFKIGLSEIKHIVETNDKKRY